MMALSDKTLRTMAIAFTGAALLGTGCVSYTKETSERTVPVPVAAATPTPSDRVVTYPEGRYQLYGDGTRTPYYCLGADWRQHGAPTPSACACSLAEVSSQAKETSPWPSRRKT